MRLIPKISVSYTHLDVYKRQGLYLYKPYPAPQDTCATPEEAYVQAQKALIMLSSSLNKGIEKVES